MIKEQDIILKVLDMLFPESKVYLFGSRARGDFTERSDIDLALEWDRKIPAHKIAQAKNIFEAFNIPYKIDIVDLNNISLEFKKLINKEKITWKE